jgi:hypothetical protein
VGRLVGAQFVMLGLLFLGCAGELRRGLFLIVFGVVVGKLTEMVLGRLRAMRYGASGKPVLLPEPSDDSPVAAPAAIMRSRSAITGGKTGRVKQRLDEGAVRAEKTPARRHNHFPPA